MAQNILTGLYVATSFFETQVLDYFGGDIHVM